jgi:hypothetical protein
MVSSAGRRLDSFGARPTSLRPGARSPSGRWCHRRTCRGGASARSADRRVARDGLLATAVTVRTASAREADTGTTRPLGRPVGNGAARSTELWFPESTGRSHDRSRRLLRLPLVAARGYCCATQPADKGRPSALRAGIAQWLLIGQCNGGTRGNVTRFQRVAAELLLFLSGPHRCARPACSGVNRSCGIGRPMSRFPGLCVDRASFESHSSPCHSTTAPQSRSSRPSGDVSAVGDRSVPVPVHCRSGTLTDSWTDTDERIADIRRDLHRHR